MNSRYHIRVCLQQLQCNLCTGTVELQEASPQTHIEIEKGVHLVLNNGDSLEQLLCIHGPHHAVHSARTRGETEQERALRGEEANSEALHTL